MKKPPSIFEKYEPHIWDIVAQSFYDRVFADDLLEHFFHGSTKTYMRAHMESLLHDYVGGPKLYRGRNLKRAHNHLLIGEEDFDRLIQQMEQALREAGVEFDDAVHILARMQAERAGIVKS